MLLILISNNIYNVKYVIGKIEMQKTFPAFCTKDHRQWDQGFGVIQIIVLYHPGRLPYDRGGNAWQKFWIKPPKETILGVAQPFYLKETILKHRQIKRTATSNDGKAAKTLLSNTFTHTLF